MPVVTGPGQALRRDRAVFPAHAGLQHVEQPEPHRLLHLGISVQFHIGAVPEVIEEAALLGKQAIPARLPGRGQGSPHLIPYAGQRPRPGPAVGDELDHAQPLPRCHDRCRADHCAVLEGLGLHADVGPVDQMIHGGADAQPAVRGPVHQDRGPVVRGVKLLHQRMVDLHAIPGVAGLGPRLLVGQQLGLQRDSHRAIQRLHLVPDRGDRPLGERHQPGGRHPHGPTGRGDPFGAHG